MLRPESRSSGTEDPPWSPWGPRPPKVLPASLKRSSSTMEGSCRVSREPSSNWGPSWGHFRYSVGQDPVGRVKVRNARGGGDAGPVGLGGLQAPYVSWIPPKKQLDLAEAKFTTQAEDLRQGAQRAEEAWASFREQSGVLQVRPPQPSEPVLRSSARPCPKPRTRGPVPPPPSLQELQGKVMEGAAALEASRCCSERLDSSPCRVQGCVGSLMEEVARADSEKRPFGGVRAGSVRLWALNALQTLLLLPLGLLVLPLLYVALAKPEAVGPRLRRLGSDAAVRRLRYMLSPLLELRARELLPA